VVPTYPLRSKHSLPATFATQELRIESMFPLDAPTETQSTDYEPGADVNH
jgi:hypothetical protein